MNKKIDEHNSDKSVIIADMVKTKTMDYFLLQKLTIRLCIALDRKYPERAGDAMESMLWHGNAWKDKLPELAIRVNKLESEIEPTSDDKDFFNASDPYGIVDDFITKQLKNE